jgi:hypothetical protein
MNIQLYRDINKALVKSKDILVIETYIHFCVVVQQRLAPNIKAACVKCRNL